VLAEAIEEAIGRGEPLTEEWRNNLKQDAVALSLNVHNDHIASAQDELYWVFSPFPGLTGTDRDALMAEMLDALSLRHGVDPIRDEARALSSRGLNPNQISKLLGVDRKTVVDWLSAT
jgi:hypothetical protein